MWGSARCICDGEEISWDHLVFRVDLFYEPCLRKIELVRSTKFVQVIPLLGQGPEESSWGKHRAEDRLLVEPQVRGAEVDEAILLGFETKVVRAEEFGIIKTTSYRVSACPQAIVGGSLMARKSRVVGNGCEESHRMVRLLPWRTSAALIVKSCAVVCFPPLYTQDSFVCLG